MNIKTGYQWKNDKCCYKVTADEAAGAFEEIRQNSGKLTPELVVDYARPKESVLHNDFEWRDEVAAEKYRQGQARQMIGAIRITSEDTQEPVRAYVNVTVVAPDEPPIRSYMPMKEVLEHPDLHSQMMADAFRDAQSFKQKYNTLERLKPVMDAMDKAFDGAAKTYSDFKREQATRRFVENGCTPEDAEKIAKFIQFLDQCFSEHNERALRKASEVNGD